MNIRLTNIHTCSIDYPTEEKNNQKRCVIAEHHSVKTRYTTALSRPRTNHGKPRQVGCPSVRQATGDVWSESSITPHLQARIRDILVVCRNALAEVQRCQLVEVVQPFNHLITSPDSPEALRHHQGRKRRRVIRQRARRKSEQTWTRLYTHRTTPHRPLLRQTTRIKTF